MTRLDALKSLAGATILAVEHPPSGEVVLHLEDGTKVELTGDETACARVVKERE